jgi:hypothetical protein
MISLNYLQKKIRNMRIDTISQILTYGNVSAFKNVVVIESCKGLLLASIVERLSGTGKIVNLSPNGAALSTMYKLNRKLILE